MLRSGARDDELSRELGATVDEFFADDTVQRPAFAVIATPSVIHFEALKALLPAQVTCHDENRS